MGLKVVSYVRVNVGKKPNAAGQYPTYVDVHGFNMGGVLADGEAGYKTFQYRGANTLDEETLTQLRALAGNRGFHVCDIDLEENQFAGKTEVRLSGCKYVASMAEYTIDPKTGVFARRESKPQAAKVA